MISLFFPYGLQAPRGSQYQGSMARGYSSRSAVDLGQFHKMSMAGAGGGGGFICGSGDGAMIYQQGEVMMGGGGGGYQGAVRQQQHQQQMSMSSMGRGDPETISLHSMRVQPGLVKSWLGDGSDAGSMVSDRDATVSRQYSQTMSNGYSGGGQMRQGGSVGYQVACTLPAPMRRSLSSTLSRGAMMGGGEAEIVQQPSFKGPAFRTISRINNNRNRMSMGSVSGGQTLQQQQMSGGVCTYGGGVADKGFILGQMTTGSQGNLMTMQRPGTLSRAMSMKSMHSVGKGMDVYDGIDSRGSLGNLSG